MKTEAQIYNLYTARRSKMQPVINAGIMIRQICNGDHRVNLPELEKGEKTAVANLILTGLEQHSTRIASVIPNIICPPLKPTKQATERADDRRMTLQAWWYANHIPLMLRLRARHLTGYATSPVMLRPNSKTECPVWEVRDPLATYPADMPTGEMVPTDCIFAFRRSRQWLIDNYGMAPGTGRDTSPGTLIDVLQYVDAEESVMLAIGTTDNSAAPYNSGSAQSVVLELSRTQHRIGQTPVMIPGRITIDRLQGQFDQMIGMYEAQGTLWAYHLHAVKRAIFKETWLEGRPNENPNIITPADPYQGDVGVVEGGNITQFTVDPGVQTIQALNMLERNQRLTGSVPADMGGESPTNVRTDRRGQSVLGGAVDYPIQEHQELLAASMEAENKCAIAIAKAYWPNTTKTFIVPFGRGSVTYTPAVTFDTDMHSVSYAYAGADTNSLVIEAGQRIAQKTISKYDFMLIDPMVKDADATHDRIILEGIEEAFVQSIQAQAADPNSPWTPDQLARLTELIYEKNLTLYKAVQKIHEETQATQAAAPQATGPEAQPGLAQAGAPGTPQAAIPPPGESQVNLADMLNSLRRPQMGPMGVH